MEFVLLRNGKERNEKKKESDGEQDMKIKESKERKGVILKKKGKERKEKERNWKWEQKIRVYRIQ